MLSVAKMGILDILLFDCTPKLLRIVGDTQKTGDTFKKREVNEYFFYLSGSFYAVCIPDF